MVPDSIITVNNLNKIYGSGHSALTVLRDINLDVKNGEILSIMGPSGAGKSTLLNIIGCLDNFDSGTVSIMNRDISGISVDELSAFRNRHLGFIFQQHNLLNEFTAEENVMIPLLIRRISFQQSKKMARDLLIRFGLGERLDHKPSELSGGECQRIAVARAMIGEPDIILADEPTGSLDTANSIHLTDMLLELGKENMTTVIIVTHDDEIAQRTGRIVYLRDGAVQPL